MEFLGDKCESVFRDNLFLSASPAFYLPSFLALPPTLLSPRGRPHLLFSGEVKNSKLGGRRWGGGEGERVPENGQNEGMSLGSFLKC